jgi:NhaA family Na+:H+ antiporter
VFASILRDMSSASLPLTPSRLAPLLRPISAFLSAESASGILLLASAVAALVWANSPWGHSYHDFWHAKLAVEVAGAGHAMSLEHWVNDGLMVIFFLLVGLEIKRELLIGELASARRASLPVAAAIGGMVVPALIYAALNARGAGSAGWGVPMATDIAFAAGALALVGRALPPSVKVFLLAVAIVDDLGAVLVIAIFYTNGISLGALAAGGAFLAALILLNVLRVHSPLPYMLLGMGLWTATLCSGVHATVAGVLLAFTIPATRQVEEAPYLHYVRRMLEIFERDAAAVPDKITDDQSHALKAMEEASQAVQTPLARVEHALLKPVSFVIVPLFALANAGVELRPSGDSALGSPVLWGVLLGLVVGKPLGILLASWTAVRSGVAALPEGATWRQVFGVSVLCGIGFTMSLFVANLAFADSDGLLGATKVGILMASVISGVAGGVTVALAGKSPDAPGDNKA